MDVKKVFIRPEPVSEVDKVKLKFLRNNVRSTVCIHLLLFLSSIHPQSDAKVKQVTVLSDEGVVYRLRALGPGGLDLYPIDLEDSVKMATVTRIWMSDTYGGSHRWGCPKINKKKFTHGIDNFRYINYESCPDAPRTPGAPGLMMGCWGSEDKTYINQRVFMRVNPGKWLAMGIYDCVPSNPLSREEWDSQSSAFQNYWVAEISSKKWATPTRVRIGLRDTLGREPSADEYEQALRDGSYKALPTNIIKEAFDLGLENLSVWCMKCVGYDADLQRALARMPKNYVSLGKKAFAEEPKKGNLAHPIERLEKVASKKRKTRASKY
ncbi:hypothetical protein BDZ94DRAFT_1172173 [Collybia nuda]|uniref:DUF6697 domain-containing protein n=1 Tax=Collybia nuda TaxID=64659 RepID=A0A9P6CEH2_9AGAR|nr:hypothetical protein BDZ94DRAFT_1172173 [Collybia nuda]